MKQKLEYILDYLYAYRSMRWTYLGSLVVSYGLAWWEGDPLIWWLNPILNLLTLSGICALIHFSPIKRSYLKPRHHLDIPISGHANYRDFYQRGADIEMWLKDNGLFATRALAPHVTITGLKVQRTVFIRFSFLHRKDMIKAKLAI